MSSKEGSNSFLKEFYESPQVPFDGIGKKIVDMAVPEKLQKKSRIQEVKELAKDLSAEGSGKDLLFEDDLFEVDTEMYRSGEKKKLSKRTICGFFMLLILIPATIAFGIYFMGDRKYYFISLAIMFYAILPFLMIFEGRKPQAREIIVLATMAAIACAGRAAFFMVPNFKPIAAIVIISGIAFGAESGFLVGALTMLVSNFMFGQGPWTPWQMFAMGFMGFLAGLLNRKGLLPAKRGSLSLFGFLATFFVYGGIMNPAALFMSTYGFTWA